MGEADPSLAFERCARCDLRWWGLLLVGAVFWITGMTLDPATNCSTDGECAPWLVPLAAAMGALALGSGAAMLIANPRRGSRIDPATGMLHWWTWRRGPRHAAEEGVVALADIHRIRVVTTSDSDHIYFYGSDGLLPVPDGEIIPWPYQEWARRLVAAHPHIELLIIAD